LPIKRTAYKELHKSKTRHLRNITIKSELRTLAKRVEKLISDKNAKEAKELLKTLASKSDKAASKGIIHKNSASRKISRLTKKLSLSAKT
jgi:small subunit ribosomal protein S20